MSSQEANPNLRPGNGDLGKNGEARKLVFCWTPALTMKRPGSGCHNGRESAKSPNLTHCVHAFCHARSPVAELWRKARRSEATHRRGAQRNKKRIQKTGRPAATRRPLPADKAFLRKGHAYAAPPRVAALSRTKPKGPLDTLQTLTPRPRCQVCRLNHTRTTERLARAPPEGWSPTKHSCNRIVGRSPSLRQRSHDVEKPKGRERFRAALVATGPHSCHGSP